MYFDILKKVVNRKNKLLLLYQLLMETVQYELLSLEIEKSAKNGCFEGFFKFILIVTLGNFSCSSDFGSVCYRTVKMQRVYWGNYCSLERESPFVSGMCHIVNTNKRGKRASWSVHKQGVQALVILN